MSSADPIVIQLYGWSGGYSAADSAIITNLQVPTGDKGQVKVYPRLNMANPKTVKHWGVKNPYTLVEVEVNDGDGSPAGDSFVASNVKVLEGTKEYPLKVAEAVAEVSKRYAAYVKKHPGCLLKEAVESIEHHYAGGDKAARATLAMWARRGMRSHHA